MFISLQSELSEKGVVSFYVRARPGMPHTKVISVMDDESIKVDIAAAAEGGKANAALLLYLAAEFDVPKNQVRIVSGATARMKLVRVVL